MSRFRNLHAPKVVETLERLEARSMERFPNRGLTSVASEVLEVGRSTAQRVRAIRRPNAILRALSFTLIAGVLFLIAEAIFTWGTKLQIRNIRDLVEFLEPTLGTAVFLGAFLVFFWTLENRWKRHAALKAIHELRSLAHIVDMHQLTKDPERMLMKGDSTKSSPKRELTPFLLGRYLDYCSELLSLISKVAALYAEDLDDPVVLNAVDQVEALTTGFSRKIWQKIIILDRAAKGANENAFTS